MKRLRFPFGIVLAAALLISQPTVSRSQTPANEKNVTEKTLTGQLINVDTKSKIISVRGPDQKEMIFSYNDDTVVISPDKTVQGLTGKPGVQLRIGYREDLGVNLAVRIELIEAVASFSSQQREISTLAE